MRILRAGAALTCLVAFSGSDPVDLTPLRTSNAPPSYFLGTEFEGLPLTAQAGTVATPDFIYGDCTPREVSAMTGLNESTVRVHLFRAARKLRALLGAKS